FNVRTRGPPSVVCRERNATYGLSPAYLGDGGGSSPNAGPTSITVEVARSSDARTTEPTRLPPSERTTPTKSPLGPIAASPTTRSAPGSASCLPSARQRGSTSARAGDADGDVAASPLPASPLLHEPHAERPRKRRLQAPGSRLQDRSGPRLDAR